MKRSYHIEIAGNDDFYRHHELKALGFGDAFRQAIDLLESLCETTIEQLRIVHISESNE